MATIAATAACIAAVGYLARVVLRITRRMLEVADVILGTDEHPALAKRLDVIEHEVVTNNGSSLRDVADRVEDLALALTHDLRGLSARVDLLTDRK
jgi:hypothetical protein